MAIFHLSHKFLKRSMGASSVAKASYNAGQKIEDNTGSTKFSDYTLKGGVLECGIMLPAGSPLWANSRGELWRRLEAREDKSTRRADAILAHNIDVALPHELTLEQNIFLLKDYVREQFTRKGYAVDWSIHAPDPRGDDRNYHTHILVHLRKIEGESFGIKDRYTKQVLSQKVSGLRQSWAGLANRHLKRYVHSARIFKDKIYTTDHIRSIVDTMRQHAKRHGGEEKLQLKKLEAELRDTEAAENKLFEAIEKSVVELDDRLKARIQQHKTKREALAAELALLQPRQQTPLQTLTPQKIEAVARVLNRRMAAPYPFSRAYLKATISEIRANANVLKLKGENQMMADLVAADGKIDPSTVVPRFIPEWCALGDSNH